ncbi:hypothetical protein [Arcobacter ellisii]|uniref:Uncharacterized protein n=1 Tax=Arcobacter ellisii TaxID=913109 RepID=A0A347U7K9_9BACT|nr:hypothetical protein [Arcobacter ellisii]AXX94837.1 hypothetical protein AELL_1168 [Arcobacter ellisii]RXI30565.1 hypothetical protein CP962_07290 [Arcobacter ellisii]
MKANRIFNYDEIKSILSAYNNHLKEFDLSKPLVTKIDLLCWGKTNNLVVFFKTDNIKFKSSVFFNEDYCARDKSICFKNLELTGRELELFISRTKRGYLNIQNAKLLEI